ncbi:MAG: twin-arginine translocase subunit TatB [Deltaproteobacteria bacterium]|nr:twin-arginine translocase subunit TatB [Deltaproteobacteria bacterium]
MFGIGTWELVVILILALIIVGPTKLPEVARTVGRNLAKLRRAADEVRREIDLEGIRADIEDSVGRDEIADLQRNLDLRGEIRAAMAELDEPSPLPGPAELPPGDGADPDGGGSGTKSSV